MGCDDISCLLVHLQCHGSSTVRLNEVKYEKEGAGDLMILDLGQSGRVP